MNQREYLDVLLEGYVNNSEFLSSYLYRQYRIAKEKHVEWNEFFTHLLEAKQFLENQIKSNYHERLNEYYLIQGSSNLPENELEKPEVGNYGIPILMLSNGKFKGHLFMADVEQMQTGIAQAWEKVKKELLPAKTDNKQMDKKIELPKIQWKKKTSLLAYLFWQLEQSGFIKGENINANVASIFVDRNYKEVNNSALNTNSERFKNRGTEPHEHEYIDSLIQLLKELDSKV